MLSAKKFVIIVPITPLGEIILYRGKRGWELPGGSIEEGETPEEAATRELFEECGVRVSKDELIFIGTLKDREGEGYIFSLLIDRNISLNERARAFRKLPMNDLAYPIHETLALVNAAIAKILPRRGDVRGGPKKSKNSRDR